MTGKMTIALLKREAELYCTQGLHREAISVYQKLLATGSTLDPEVRKAAQCRVDQLTAELAALESGAEEAISTTEIDLIRGGWKDAGDACDLYNCARAFLEMGLYEEALAEYVKLYHPLRPEPDVLAGLCECLSRLCEPENLLDRIARLLQAHGLDARETAEAQFDLAAIAEKSGFTAVAVVLYRAVHRCDPDFPEVRQRLNDLGGRGASCSGGTTLWSRIFPPSVVENTKCRGFFHRLKMLLSELASRFHKMVFPALRP